MRVGARRNTFRMMSGIYALVSMVRLGLGLGDMGGSFLALCSSLILLFGMILDLDWVLILVLLG